MTVGISSLLYSINYKDELALSSRLRELNKAVEKELSSMSSKYETASKDLEEKSSVLEEKNEELDKLKADLGQIKAICGV